MDESKGIFNIGDLAQPITTLIEKIADATGVLYEPRKIKKLAKAQAEADLIKAKSEIEISDLQKRGLHRFVEEEGKKQENLESIMEKTIPLLEEGSKPEEMNDDWVMNFFDKAKLISDEEMQILWAKILAGEANNPNSFSKRTVNFLASIDKKEAEIFSYLCNFIVKLDDIICPIIFDQEDSFFNNSEITFYNLTHLESIGLIRLNDITGFNINTTNEEINCCYFDKSFQMKTKFKEGDDIKIGTVIFTPLGNEILKLCNIEPIEGYFDYFLSKLSEQPNLEISFNNPNKDDQQSKSPLSVSETKTDFVKFYSEW